MTWGRGSLALTGWAALGLGCSQVTCSCGVPFDGLYVNVSSATIGDVVEVCSANDCGTVTVQAVDAPSRSAQLPIPVAQLGDWASHRDSSLTVSVRNAGGVSRPATTSIAKKHHPECCGDYWDITA